MTADEFEKALHWFKYHQPPAPYVVELIDGQRIVIDDPQAVGFNGTSASFLSSKGDLVDFSHVQVRAIRPLIPTGTGGSGGRATMGEAMTVEEFEEAVRAYIDHEPPAPFVVELTSGRSITIDDPQALAFGGGAACFLGPDYEMIDFSCREVRAVRPAVQGAAS